MHRSSLKSQVIENSNPSMLYSKEIGGAKTPDPEPIGDWSINAEDDGAQIRIPSRPLKAIVIVEPRLRRAAETTNSTSSNSDWFMLPTTVDFTNDMMRLVSSLSSVVQILTRMTNAAAQELRLHPEREEGFQGLRTLLNYADQMYTTLLQPQTFSMSRPESQRNQPAAQSHSLFHHLFEPIRNAGSRGEAPSTSPSPLAERSRSSRRRRPYRVVAVTASEASLDFDADADPNGNGL